jgi:phosphoglycerol transferase
LGCSPFGGVWWCLDRKHWSRRSLLAALCIGVAHGVQNPYYTNLFLQLLVLAALALLIRRAPLRNILVPILIGAVAAASFLIVNFDSIASRIAYGPNLLANARLYAGVELYALKPLELFLPVTHRSPWLAKFVEQAYLNRALFLGEPSSPYLGIVSIAGLAALLWTTAKAIIGKLTPVPRHFYIILWLVAYSVVGGLNALLGVFGIVVFRGTNRFSIAIMAVILLFVSKALTRRTKGWSLLHKLALVVAILGIGLWDQLPPSPPLRKINEARKVIASDAQFAAAMEKTLPPGAMVFQLPVMPYPESGGIGKMGDYEHFRPYLFTSAVHYSYGSDKGRTRERWQAEAAALAPSGLIAMTERYGFSAMLLNKKGYADRGSALLDAFRALGRGTVVAESPDLVCVALNPAAQPTLPPDFDEHWHNLEGTIDANWRWSDGSASVILHNNSRAPANAGVTFRLEAGGARRIAISHSGRELYRRDFSAGDPPADVILKVPVDAESTELRFVTNRSGEVPGNGDPRKLAFNVRDFKVTP